MEISMNLFVVYATKNNIRFLIDFWGIVSKTETCNCFIDYFTYHQRFNKRWSVIFQWSHSKNSLKPFIKPINFSYSYKVKILNTSIALLILLSIILCWAIDFLVRSKTNMVCINISLQVSTSINLMFYFIMNFKFSLWFLRIIRFIFTQLTQVWCNS